MPSTPKVATLNRFRADPRKVTVGIRWDPDVGWVVDILGRRRSGQTVTIAASHHRPKAAVVLALRSVERAGIQGIDLAMAWTYEHPQRRRP